MNGLILALFFFYSGGFKSYLDGLLEQMRYAEALKIIEDSFRANPGRIEFEKLRVYVLAYQGSVFDASNAYLRLYEATSRHEPELLHRIALGIFDTDNEKLARFLTLRIPLIHDIEAELPLLKFIKKLDNSKRGFYIKNLNKIADSNVFWGILDLAKDAGTYEEVFTISPLLSRLTISTGYNIVDTLLSSKNTFAKAIGLWIAGDKLNTSPSFFTKYESDRNDLVSMMAKIGRLKHVPKPDLALLEPYINSQKKGIKKILAFHLGFFGMKAEPMLLSLLNNTDDDVKREAAKSLFYMGSEKALTPFIQAMSYLDPKKKIWGIDNLALVSDSSVTPLIAKALSSPYPAVKIHAIWALATLGGAVARRMLYGLLTGSNAIIKREAAFALGYMGDAKSIIQITRLARSNDALTRKRAMWILCRLGDYRGYKYLFDGLKDESLDVRVMSALGLWHILNNSDRVKIRELK